MVGFIVTLKGRAIGTGFGSERDANSFRVNFIKQNPGTNPRIQSVPDPTPIPPSGGFQIFTVDKGGGRTPQTTSVFRTFGTRQEAQNFLEANRRSIADRETPVGIRSTPTAAQEAAFKRTKSGAQITGPPPKGKPTTRTAAEQLRIQQKAATLALKNIRAGKSQASAATIKRLQAQEKTQKQFVEQRIMKQLRTGTTATQFKTFAEIKKERTAAIVQRARETKKQQLRKIGGELIFKPSIEFFERVPGAVAKKRKLPIESKLIQELRAQKGFVTFKAPTKPKEIERVKQISVFRPVERKKTTLTTRAEFVTSLFERQGFTVTPEGKGVRAVKKDVEIITTPSSLLVAKGPVTEGALKFQPAFKEKLGTGERPSKFIIALKQQLLRIGDTKATFKTDIQIGAAGPPALIGSKIARFFLGKPTVREDIVGKFKEIEKAPLVSIGIPLVIGAGLTLLPEPATTVVGVGLLGSLGVQLFKAKPRERQKIATGLIIDLPFFITGGKVGKSVKDILGPAITKLRPSFKPVEVEVLGEQVIKQIKTKEGELIDLGLIPPKGDLPGLKPDPTKFILGGGIPFKEIPTLPRTSKLQSKILDLAREEPVIVTGSFAQQTLLRKSRGFADIDIVTKDVPGFAKKLKAKLGDEVTAKTVTITDSPLGKFKIVRITERKTGNIIADIDPLKFAEEGILKGPGPIDINFPIRTVEGVRLAPLEARLAAKLKQLERRKITSKVIEDITLLTGGKVKVRERLESPLIRGAFGFTRAEQAVFTGKTGPVTTSARDLFGIIFRRKVEVKEPGLFATPFEVRTGRALTRVSRLALKQREATRTDLFKFDFTLKPSRPQIIIFPKQKIGEEFKLPVRPSSELEVLLGAGKIIKREKQIGITLIEGKPVPIIQASIGAASKRARDLISKKQLSIAERTELRKRLRKETGFETPSALRTKPLLRPSRFIPKLGVTQIIITKPIGRRLIIPSAISTLSFLETSGRPRVPPSRKPSGAVSSALLGPISGPPSAPPSKPPSAPPSIPPSFPPSAPPSGPPSRPPSRPPSGPPSAPPSGPPKVPPSFPREERGRILKPGFDTFLRRGAKRGSRFDKISDNLPKNRAIVVGRNAADNFIENSFRIQRSGRKTRLKDVAPPNLIKFRGIKKGSVLPGDTIIEKKGKFRLDKATERLQLSFFRERALSNRIRGQIRTRKQRKEIKQAGGFVTPIIPNRRLRFI